MTRQLSFFTAGEVPPTVDDLEGLLAGPGHVVRRADEARIGVVVSGQWRVPCLLTAFAERGLAGDVATALDGQPAVRTAFSATLLPIAGRWTRGARILPPLGFGLDGPRLRLWAIAGGRGDEYGYALQLGDTDDGGWSAIGSALHDAGLPGTLVGPRADGPAYRITGTRRIARLRELVGEAPPGAPAEDWPG
ncbi:MAG: hypothetical protein DLM59_16995 [Pseudonocardiales bacterium]|nr:MAG: hypothetical protein DLM59_16995 [Pseudonocardiales bacterium]